jgi:hypothetical protein
MIKLIDLVENDTVPSEEKKMQNFLNRGSRDQNKEWEPQRMHGRKGTIEGKGPLTTKHPENTNSSQRYNNGYPSDIANADPNIFEDESEVDKIHQALIGREFQSLNDVGKMASRLRQAGYAQSEIEALVQNYII